MTRNGRGGDGMACRHASCEPVDLSRVTRGRGSSSGGPSDISGSEFACVLNGARTLTTGLTPQTLSAVQADCAGEARVGEPPLTLRPTQVGWLDRPMGAGGTQRDPATGDRVLTVANDGPEPMRLLLYAGERQGVPLVSYGPLIGDTRDDIVRSFERYKTGTFQRY